MTKSVVLQRAAAYSAILIFFAFIQNLAIPRADAFGTYNGGGQAAEHEHITRAALACPAGKQSDDSCFEPMSMTQLAGTNGQLGGIGWPDNPATEVFGHDEAHCDNADYLVLPNSSYDKYRTSNQAITVLIACVNHMRDLMAQSSLSAADLVDNAGKINAEAAGKGENCVGLLGGVTSTAKCRAIVAFGRAMHGVQDFYAHSNWTDFVGTGEPFYNTESDPPGLGLSAHAYVLDLNSRDPIPDPPTGFTTGCFFVKDVVGGFGPCLHRVTHAALAKDEGTIDPFTGAATSPKTLRGSIHGNFAAAVKGAIEETKFQWDAFRSRLVNAYGSKRGERIACVLTHDHPSTDCIQAAIDYTADLTSQYDCTGSCFSTGERVHSDVIAHLTAHVDIPHLPTSTEPVTAVGQLTASTASGNYRRDYSSQPHSFGGCYPLSGFDVGVLIDVKPSPVNVVSLSIARAAGGKPSDVQLHWKLTTSNDIWHHVDTRTGPSGCEDKIVNDANDQLIAASVNNAHFYSTLNQGNIDSLVDGWTLTPDSTDGTIATKTLVLDYSQSDTSPFLGGSTTSTNTKLTEHYTLSRGQ